MKIAHWEFWTGISGDMWVGACLDAGWPESRLLEIPGRLGLADVRISVESRRHSGFVGRGIRVESSEAHPHRGLSEIRAILSAGDLEAKVRAQSLSVFERLAEAEARIHGTSLDEVHFHEVGALDAIVDVVASVRALHDLGIESLTADAVPISGGQVTAAHGTMPVPAPATALLLAGWPVRPSPGDGEWITPTGAALLVTLASARTPMPEMRVGSIGMGAGSRTHPFLPNLVRLWIGDGTGESPEALGGAAGRGASDAEPDWSCEVVSVLETQVDDMTGEELGALAAQLREAGALDVTLEPVYMKKGRPGVRVQVVVRPSGAGRIVERVFGATPTLGIRRREERRYERSRGERRVQTPWGEVGLKWVGSPDDPAPEVEFDDVSRLALERGVSFRVAERDLLVFLTGKGHSGGDSPTPGREQY